MGFKIHDYPIFFNYVEKIKNSKHKQLLQCPYGMQWDNWLQRCVAIPPPGIVCPKGEIWDNVFNTCMIPAPIPVP